MVREGSEEARFFGFGVKKMGKAKSLITCNRVKKIILYKIKTFPSDAALLCVQCKFANDNILN